MKKVLTSPALWIGLIVALAMALRIVPYLHVIFTPFGTWFMGADPWYQMRLVDNMIANFPAPLAYDPYALFPGGAVVGYRPLLPWLVAGIAYVVGLGHPGPELVDAVGAFLPPVLGGLMIIPVYVLGVALFKRRAVGVMAAIFVAVLPTELFHRGILGFTDHHIIEAFLATLTLMFLALAWDRGKVHYGAMAGGCLGLYLINWHGSIFFAGVITAALVIAFILYYLRHPGEIYWKIATWKSGAICFAIAALIYLPYIPQTLSPRQFLPIILEMGLMPLLIIKGADLIRSRKVYLATFLSIVAAHLVIGFFVMPELWDFVIFQLRGTFWGFGSTIQEAMPYSIGLMLRNYGILQLVALAGLVLAFKYRANPLFTIWTVVIILATIGQRRWDYYAAVNFCILAAFFLVYLGRYLQEHWRPFVWGVTVVAMIISVLPAELNMLRVRPNITPDWVVAMAWLHEQMPPPFGDDNIYYQLEGLHDSPPVKPSYGVISWWDYGHWIIRLGKRVPVSSPTQQETEQGYCFFIAQSEEEAEEALSGMNIKYIIIDRDMVDGKFYAMVMKAGATKMSLGYWQNSIAYRLFYFEGLGFMKYKLRFLSPTVKIFERIPVNEER